YPQFLPGPGVEGAEAAVIGRANEDQSAGRGERAPEIRPAGFLLVLGQSFRNPQHRLPHDFAGIDIDRYKTAPGRLLARPARIGIPESSDRPQRTRARPRR